MVLLLVDYGTFSFVPSPLCSLSNMLLLSRCVAFCLLVSCFVRFLSSCFPMMCYVMLCYALVGSCYLVSVCTYCSCHEVWVVFVLFCLVAMVVITGHCDADIVVFVLTCGVDLIVGLLLLLLSRLRYSCC